MGISIFLEEAVVVTHIPAQIIGNETSIHKLQCSVYLLYREYLLKAKD